jgi:ATP/maltotriose-dependent transcriptional regulator MalT
LALRGEVDALLGLLYYYKLDGERAYGAASRALRTLPMTSSSARGLAWMYLGAGYQMLGDVNSARSALHEGLKEDRFHGNAFPSRILRLPVEGKVAEFVGHVLAAFRTESDGTVERRPNAASRPSTTGLVAPLTDRELEILGLLAKRLSAKEIARQLVISDRTVKRHTANIYQKLGVNSRQQAVKVAVASGILVVNGEQSPSPLA